MSEPSATAVITEPALAVAAPTLGLALGPLWGCAVDAKTGALTCTTRDYYASADALFAIVLSDWFAAALTVDGDVVTWTKLKPGDPAASAGPDPISGRNHVDGVRFVDIAASRTEICVLDQTGSLSCWHWGRFEPRKVQGLKAFSSIASCGAFVCGTFIDGQLAVIARGQDPGTGRYDVLATPIPRAIGFTSGGFVHQEPATGQRIGCGIRQKKVACAGDLASSFAERMTELGPAIQLVGNEHAACAITPERTLRCIRADLGDPFGVSKLRGVHEVVVGSDGQFACARLSDQSVRCFSLARDAQNELLDPFPPPPS